MPPASPCGPQRPLAHLGIEPPLWSCGHSQTAWLGLSPSWHRRQRRQRATARVYLRAHFAPFSPRSVAAATCIARHHGSTRPRTAAQPEDNWSIGGSMTWVCCLCAASNRSRLVGWRCGSTEEEARQSWNAQTDANLGKGNRPPDISWLSLDPNPSGKGVQSHTLRGKAIFPPRPPGILQPEGIRFPLQALCWSNGQG